MSGTLGLSLLKLDNATPNLPVGGRHCRIYISRAPRHAVSSKATIAA